MEHTFTLTSGKLVEAVDSWIENASDEELAKMVQHMFNCKCFSAGDTFVITPTSEYNGELDEYKDEKS